MKKIIALLLIVNAYAITINASPQLMLPAATQLSLTDSLLKYLSGHLKYPEKAKLNGTQGTSIILFTLKEGKLSNLKIHAELGDGGDTDVLNAILAYPDFEREKNGNYALQTDFRLGQAVLEITTEIPEGYQLLKLVVTDHLDAQVIDARFTPTEGTNGAKDIILRGAGSNGINKALVIVDGEMIPSEQVNLINPDDIESLSILKDASAIFKYGINAQFGVILVTTKNKKENQTTEPTKNQ